MLCEIHPTILDDVLDGEVLLAAISGDPLSAFADLRIEAVVDELLRRQLVAKRQRARRVVDNVASWIREHQKVERRLSVTLLREFRRQKRIVISGVHARPDIKPADSMSLLPRGRADRQLRDAVVPALLDAVLVGAKRCLRQINARRRGVRKVDRVGTLTGSEGILLEIGDERLDSMRQYLDEAWGMPYWTSVNDTTRDYLWKAIDGTLRDAGTYRDIANLIQGDSSGMFGQHRAMRIARTEATTAMNGGHYAMSEQLIEQVAETGVVGKEWNTIGDADVRGTDPKDQFSHVDADGQRAMGKGAVFVVSGEPARFPGDPTLSAGNRIHCRCTILDVFEEDIAEAV